MSKQVVIALLFSLVFVGFPLQVSATAPSDQITHNDGICDLGQPGYLGDGSHADPFHIPDADALWEVTDCSLTGSPAIAAHFLLTQNIDPRVADKAPTQSPIGSASPSVRSFSGVLEGNGKTIGPIGISYSGVGKYLALFETLEDAEIKNLLIYGDVYGPGNVSQGNTGAGLAGETHGFTTLSNVISSVSVVTRFAGGLVGDVVSGRLDIMSSSNLTDLSNRMVAAGLVSYVYEASVLNVERSSNFGSVSASYAAAGLVASSDGDVFISNSYNHGEMRANRFVGGLLAEAYGSTTITTSQNFGEMTNFRDSPDFSSTGGLVGYANGSSSIGTQLSIIESTNHGSVRIEPQVQAQYAAAGGLVGSVTDLERFLIQDSSNSGDVISPGNGLLGGLVGDAEGTTLSKVLESVNSGNVRGGTLNNFVGGLFGYFGTGNLQVSTSYSTGGVFGGDHVGALAGATWDSTLSAELFYSTGVVSASGDAAGFIGEVGDSQIQLSNSYHSGGLSGAQSDGLVHVASGPNPQFIGVLTSNTNQFLAETSVELLRTSTPYLALGWDFDSDWGFGMCSENGGFPILRNLTSIGTIYADGCYTPPAPAAQPSPAAPPIYFGPILESSGLVLEAGSEAIFRGKRLTSVFDVTIGGVRQTLTSMTENELRLVVSERTPRGIVDIVLKSDFGTLTLQAGVIVQEKTREISASSLLGKTKLLPRSNSLAQAWMSENLTDSGVKRLVCTVTVTSAATMAQRIEARKLAKQTCNQAAEFLEAPSIWFQTKPTNTRFVGRVFLTFKG